MGRHAFLGPQLGGQLRHRDIGIGLNPVDHYPQIWRKFATPGRAPLPRRFS